LLDGTGNYGFKKARGIGDQGGPLFLPSFSAFSELRRQSHLNENLNGCPRNPPACGGNLLGRLFFGAYYNDNINNHLLIINEKEIN
jgi:hypothetical protein